MHQLQECERSCAGVYMCVYDDLVHSRDVAQCEDRLSGRQILSWLFGTQTHLYLHSWCAKQGRNPLTSKTGNA